MCHDYLQRTFHGFECFVATWAFIETFLLSGHSAGWASLVYVLKIEGVYQFLCQNTSNEQISLSTSPRNDSVIPITEVLGGNETDSLLWDTKNDTKLVSGCPEQDAMFELCVTSASVLSAPFNLLLSQVNFYYGMRTTRIISILLLLVGTVSFGAITTESPWLMFIGYICVGNGGVGILQTNNQVSYMFKTYGPTIIGAVCGAFDASGAVYLGVKMAYEHGIARSTSFIVIGLSSILTLISTFLFLPKDFIRPLHVKEQTSCMEMEFPAIQGENGTVNKEMSEKTYLINDTSTTYFKDKLFTFLRKAPKLNNTESNNFASVNERCIHTGKEPEKTNRNSVLLKYMCNPLYSLLILWASVNQLLFTMFIGSLNAWLHHVTNGVDERVSHFTNFVFYAMLSAPIFSILSGAAVNFLFWIQSDSRNKKIKTLYALAGPSSFTSLTGVLLCACVITEKEEATYLTGIISVIYRSALYSYWGTFIQALYPTEYFAALYGITIVLCGTVTFLQYPLFLWCQSSINGYRQVYIMLGLLTLSTLVQPIYLLYTGWNHCPETKTPSE